MWFRNLKMFCQILPRYSQSIKRVIDTWSVLWAEKKKIIKKIVFLYGHLVSVTLKYHRKNNSLIRYYSWTSLQRPPWGHKKVAVAEKFKQESLCMDCPPKMWPLWRGGREWRLHCTIDPKLILTLAFASSFTSNLWHIIFDRDPDINFVIDGDLSTSLCWSDHLGRVVQSWVKITQG